MGEGYTGARRKLAWVRGSRRGRIFSADRDPSSGSFRLPPSPTRGEGTFQAGLKNGSGAPSVGLNTTFTFWPIFKLSLMRKSATGPYAIGYVTLKEGPSLLTNFVDCDMEKLKIGQRVKVVFKPTDGAPLPFFTLA